MYEISFYAVVVTSILIWIVITFFSLTLLKISLVLYVVYKKLNVLREKIRCHVASIAGN